MSLTMPVNPLIIPFLTSSRVESLFDAPRKRQKPKETLRTAASTMSCGSERSAEDDQGCRQHQSGFAA